MQYTPQDFIDELITEVGYKVERDFPDTRHNKDLKEHQMRIRLRYVVEAIVDRHFYKEFE